MSVLGHERQTDIEHNESDHVLTANMPADVDFRRAGLRPDSCATANNNKTWPVLQVWPLSPANAALLKT